MAATIVKTYELKNVSGADLTGKRIIPLLEPMTFHISSFPVLKFYSSDQPWLSSLPCLNFLSSCQVPIANPHLFRSRHHESLHLGRARRRTGYPSCLNRRP